MKPADLCLALDVPTAAEAVQWVERTRDHIGTYKVGLQLFCAEGKTIIEKIRTAGADRIFLDLKLHDIPNTVAGAIQALGDLGVDLLTVHAGGGPAMLARAVQAAAPAGIDLLAVTVLTSLETHDLEATGVEGTPASVAAIRARLALEAGVPGLVCSPHEVAQLRADLGAEPILVTPGIRLEADAWVDQRRVATPQAALDAGASLLVLGRAIRNATDPIRTLDALLGRRTH